MIRILLAALLLINAPLRAQPADEGHRLAAAFLDKVHIDQLMEPALLGAREATMAVLIRSGATREQAGDVFDSLMMPEFRERLPELRAKFEDILVADFTVPELHAVLEDQQNDARRSAAAKAGQLQGQFAAAGSTWGRAVGEDVYVHNKAALDKLGLHAPTEDAQ